MMKYNGTREQLVNALREVGARGGQVGAIADAAAEELRATTWQPIETALKDGTPVLLFGGSTDETGECEQPNGYENRPVVGVWIDGEWMFAFWDGAWRSTYMNPTQWMPLPELPAEGEAG